MTDDHSLERAARSWLNAGPTEAPDHAVEAALLQIRTIDQERDIHVPWRTRPMTNTTRLLAGAAAIAVLLVGGAYLLRPSANIGVGSATPGPPTGARSTPSGSPSVPGAALTQTFRSFSYGFTVRYPAGWTINDAGIPWTIGSANGWDTSINDELYSSTARFSGASQLLVSGQTAAQWIADYARGADTGAWPRVTIGGQPGLIDYDGVPARQNTIAPGGVMFDSVVVVGNRAYNFNMDGRIDRATFEAFLSTITIDPTKAVDAPLVTFTSARHGFSISIPSNWNVSPATAPWPTGTQAAARPNSMLDDITIVGTGWSLDVASSPLAKGMTPDAWLTAYEASAPQVPAACRPAPAQMEKATVGGQTAWIHGGLPLCGFTEAIVFAGGRVYELTAYSRGDGTPINRTLFDALLATLRFDPSGADDSPAASARPS